MCARCRSRARHAMPARASSPGRSPSCSRSPGWSCRAGPGRRWPARRSNRRTGPRVRAEPWLWPGTATPAPAARAHRSTTDDGAAGRASGFLRGMRKGPASPLATGHASLDPGAGIHAGDSGKKRMPAASQVVRQAGVVRGPTVVKPGVVGQDCLRLCSSPSGQAVEEGDASRRTTWRPGGQATGRSTTRSTRQ